MAEEIKEDVTEQEPATDETQESTEPEFDKDAILARLEEAEKAKKSIQRRYEEERRAKAELLKQVETEEQRAERERRERAEELGNKEKQLKSYERELTKAAVMIREKVPARFEKFLIGETDEEITESWKALKESIDSEAKTIRTENAGKAVPTAGAKPATDFSKMTLDEATKYVKEHPDQKEAVLSAQKHRR